MWVAALSLYLSISLARAAAYYTKIAPDFSLSVCVLNFEGVRTLAYYRQARCHGFVANRFAEKIVLFLAVVLAPAELEFLIAKPLKSWHIDILLTLSLITCYVFFFFLFLWSINLLINRNKQLFTESLTSKINYSLSLCITSIHKLLDYFFFNSVAQIIRL